MLYPFLLLHSPGTAAIVLEHFDSIVMTIIIVTIIVMNFTSLAFSTFDVNQITHFEILCHLKRFKLQQ